MQYCDFSRRGHSFIEDWLDSQPQLPHQPSHKRKHADPSAARPAMSTPPPSELLSSSPPRRADSPSKKRKLPARSREQDKDDDPFIGAAGSDPNLDPDATPRRTTGDSFIGGFQGTRLPRHLRLASGNVASIPFDTPSIASSGTTNTSANSRARSNRSASPKKTQSLEALRKPIYHVTIKDNATKQLPPDVLPLYDRVYNITIEHDGVFPREIRDEIIEAVGRPLKDFWFAKRSGDMCFADGATGEQAVEHQQHHQQQRARALAELAALRKLERAASDCRLLGKSEAAWNLEVHGPLLELGLAGHVHVGRELVTTAQVARPFVPPMNDYSRHEFVDRKMVDFVLLLVPCRDGLGGEERVGEDVEAEQDGFAHEGVCSKAARYLRLAQAIKRAVQSQPKDQQTINQTAYTPLWHRPIGVSIETKADGMSEEGRTQLATWTAAWHERMRILMGEDGYEGRGRIISLPVLLIVEHSWVLSFVCDRGDRLEVVGDVSLGDTRTLTGLYTLVAVVRELGDWVEGPFYEWMEHVLCGFYH